MKNWIACFTLLVFASGASAATLTITANAPYVDGMYVPLFAQPITLTIWGDDQDWVSYGIYGRLLYNESLADAVGSTQMRLTSSFPGWVKGPLQSGPGYIEAFNQVNLQGLTADNLPGQLATVTLLPNAPGLIPVNWDTTLGTGLGLDFFGLTNAPGVQILCCSDEPIPEPSPHLLLGLGLIALAAIGRWRTE